MKKFTTTRKALSFQAMVCTQFGSPTGCKVMVPYDSPKRFSIGHLEFDVRVAPTGKHFAYAQGEIPQAWFVDLNGDA